MATEIITPMQMYWISRLTPVTNMLSGIVTLLVVVTVILTITTITMPHDVFGEKTPHIRMRFIKIVVATVILSLVFGFANMLTPTTREAAAILIVPRIANSEKVQTVGNHLYDLAVEWMDELRPRKTEVKKEAN